MSLVQQGLGALSVCGGVSIELVFGLGFLERGRGGVMFGLVWFRTQVAGGVSDWADGADTCSE